MTAFIGANGPYWTDANHDHTVQDSELNSQSKGFHITDLDVGLLVMAAIPTLDNPTGAGVYLAGKASVHSFGLVGIDILSATGTFSVAINVGLGLDTGLAVVDFATTFSEQLKLFDTNHDGTVTVGELRTLTGHDAGTGAFAGLYAAGDAAAKAVDLTAIATALDATANGGNGDGFVQISEAQSVLATAGAAAAADINQDGRLNAGYEVNTGDPTSPVILDMSGLLIRVHLAGAIKMTISGTEVFSLSGEFLMEVTDSYMQILAVGDLSIGGGILTFSADGLFRFDSEGLSARLLLHLNAQSLPGISFFGDFSLYINTTMQDVNITIPDDFTSAFEGETLVDGKRTVVISAEAPQLPGVPENGPSAYLVVMADGGISVANVITFEGTVRFGVELDSQNVLIRVDVAASLSLGSIRVPGGERFGPNRDRH